MVKESLTGHRQSYEKRTGPYGLRAQKNQWKYLYHSMGITAFKADFYNLSLKIFRQKSMKY
jgi:hypothetical protein